MKTLLVLGINGMLGSAGLKCITSKNINIDLLSSYSNQRKFEFLSKNYKNIHSDKFIKFNLLEDDLSILPKNIDIVINCIGVIKPFIDENNSTQVKNAIKINSNFPYQLSEYFNKSIIFQIATDCVFSGSKGNYDENSKHDCIDIYGKTKSLGEVKAENFFNIRCSIIGREVLSKYSLLEWFLSQNSDQNINGFTDHVWNGLTTTCFFELLISIIVNDIKIPNNIHLKPSDKVNKYELLKLFKNKFIKDIEIKPLNSKNYCDRSLDTVHPDINELVWKKSIYKKKLTIEEMINNL